MIEVLLIFASGFGDIDFTISEPTRIEVAPTKIASDLFFTEDEILIERRMICNPRAGPPLLDLLLTSILAYADQPGLYGVRKLFIEDIRETRNPTKRPSIVTQSPT